MKTSHFFPIALVTALFLPGMTKGLCPSITIDIPDIPSGCVGETVIVSPRLEEIAGDCNHMTTYPYKRWKWVVIGNNIVDPMAGNTIPARFVTVRGGHGKIIFNLICRSRACPDCNRNFEVEKEFDVVHVAIEQRNLMVCGKDNSAYLNVTDDTHAPDGVVWTSRPHGIHGHGSSVSFRPSQLVPGAYTVKAANDGTPSCPDVCEVHVIKVNIPTTNIFVCAEDSLASLSLSGDSYSPGGYVWSSTPDGISGCGPDKTITFVPSNLPPGKYVVHCQSADLEDCLDECEVNILKVELESDKAVESPKPFDCGKTEADIFNPFEFTPKYDFWNIVQGPENDAINSSLTIYHDEVSDAAGDAQDFDIKLRVLPNDVPTIWSLKSGPASSGILTDAGQSEATFSNPTKGGRYIFTVVVGGITTDVQIWLPISGPDISAEFQSQINYIKNDWGPRYQSNLLVRVNTLFPWYAQLSMDASTYLALLLNQKVDDLLSFGLDMDYELIGIGLISDVGGLANVEVAGPAGGDRDRFSMKGASRWYVTDFSKRSNMAYAMAARAMGFPSLAITEGPDLYLKYVSVAVGTRDTPAAKESYRAGIDLIDGQTLQQVLDARGRAMQAPSGRSRKEWPDSTSASTTYLDLNTNAHTTMEALTVAP